MFKIILIVAAVFLFRRFRRKGKIVTVLYSREPPDLLDILYWDRCRRLWCDHSEAGNGQNPGRVPAGYGEALLFHASV